MRTLSKPPKIKSSTSQNKNQKQDKKEGKTHGKKVSKTIFTSPFRYKIQTLTNQDAQTVANTLINFSKMTRSELMLPQKKMNNDKIIKFQSKVSHEKPPLICKYLFFGLKNNIQGMKNNKISLCVLFYQQSIHDKFQELMCHVIYYKVPYIVMKGDKKVNDELGVKKLLALGISHEELEATLLKYCSKCLIEIPWLVDHTWIPLQKKK